MPQLSLLIKESERLASLYDLQILDTAPEERFDRIIRLAAHAFQVPIALLSFVDQDRQWNKSSYGISQSEVPRAVSFCAHAVQENQPLIVPDARRDARFANNPLVTDEPYIRFYAGYPVRTADGSPVGALCIMDYGPRDLTPTDQQLLQDLARLTESEFTRQGTYRVENQELRDVWKPQHNMLITTVLDTIDSLLLVTDPEGHIINFNRACEQVSGYQDEELAGQKSWDVLVAPEDVETVQEVMQKLRSTRQPSRHVSYWLTKKGERRLIEWYNTCALNHTGEVEYIISTGTDITERNLIREKLDVERNLFHTLIDNAPGQIYVKDTQSRFIMANKATLQLLGANSVDEIVGKTDFDFFPREHAEQYYADEQRIIRTGEPLVNHEEPVIEHGTGRPRWNMTTKVPYRDPSGKVVGILGINLDITDRKETEEKLAATLMEAERARSEINAILDATNDALMLLSPTRRILTVNRSADALFGPNQSAEIVGSRLEDLASRFSQIFENPEDFYQFVERSSVGEPGAELMQPMTQQWPERRDLKVTCSPVRTTSGKFLGTLYVFHDITQERAIDRVKTEFISMVSHELRTPLTSIKGYVDLLLMDVDDRLSEEQREFLEIIQINAERLVTLVNDLLDVSRIESGNIQLKPTRLDLPVLIQQVTNSFRQQIEQKQQTLTLDFPRILPAVWADADRTLQILSNLISNAHKYTLEGGNITVSATFDEQKRYVRVDVSDTGVGLSDEERARLFTKFYRAHNAATRGVNGTGLGLAITRSLVEMQGGEITVRSDPGKGSTFSFTLPTIPAFSPPLARVGD